MTNAPRARIVIPMTDTVTSAMYKPGDVDEAAYAKFVAKTERGYRKARDRGAKMYAGWTEAEIVKAARFYCGCYRHQFRVLVKVPA